MRITRISSGKTPTIIRGTASTVSCWPSTLGDLPKRRFHSPSLMSATFGPPGTSSASVKSRPRIGFRPTIRIMFQVMTPPRIRSGERFFAPAGEVHRLGPVKREIGEAALHGAPVEIVRISHRARLENLHPLPQQNELVRIRIRQRAEKDRFDHAEDGGVGPDPEGEGDDGDDAESGRLDQIAEGIAEVS